MSGICLSPCSHICNARAPAPSSLWWLYGTSDTDCSQAETRCLDLECMRWRSIPISSSNYSFQGNYTALYYFEGELWYFALDDSGSGGCNVYKLRLAEGDGERREGEEFQGMMMRRLRQGSRFGVRAVREVGGGGGGDGGGIKNV